MIQARVAAPASNEHEALSPATVDRLLRVAQDIAAAHEVARVSEIVRIAVRELTGADGVTFVLREGRLVHYYDEDAISPLWRGMRFPIEACISGWTMLNRQPAVIENVFLDDRIPHDVYRPTFVKSLAMVPVRPEDPVGAIGVYWAEHHRASTYELRIVTMLAGFATVALANAALIAELREAVAAREAFVGIASHELRTPLSALALQVALAERGTSRAERDWDGVRAAIQRIGRTTRRLTELVERLLDVSTLRQRRIAIQREAVDLAEIARNAAEAFGDPNQTEVRVDAALPVIGHWDRVRIEQVVGNLIANAVKFGSGQPVDVIVTTSGTHARLVVRDRGIGVPPDAQERIFERFERAAPSTNYGGFGLGLWIVRQTIEAHGGAITLTSNSGEGSTFTVTLPLG